MALTLKEITDQIDSFLHEVPQKYKEQFEKIIFSALQDCINIIIDLTHSELTIEALKLRVLRIGMDLEQNNKGSIHVDLGCLQDLSKVFSVNDIEDNIKHKIAYASIAYFVSRGCTAQETLENFALTKQVLQQGGRLPFAIIDADFIKIYYAFCLALSSCRTKNITVHAAYDDLPVQDRIGNSMFETRILSYAIRALSFLTSLNLEDQIGVIAAYSTISATGYERPQLCEPSYIEQIINFATNEVKQEMLKRNILASMLKYGNSDGDMRKAATEMMQVAFPEIAERSAKLEATKEAIKEAKAYIHNIEEELKRRLKEIETYYRAIEQQSIGNINSQIAQAKRDAHNRAFQSTLKQAGAIAAGCFVGPAACGALGVSVGIATTVTSAAIGGATQTVITGGDLGDILKSAAIAGVTAGVMSKVPVSSELTGAAKRIEGAKLGVINSAVSTGASTIVHGKGKLDPVTMLGAGLAGAGGVNTEGLTKDLTERVIKDTTAAAIHGGKLVPNLLTGVIESTASYFGKTMGEELKSNIEADRALSDPKLVLEPQSQQEKDDRIKAKGKDRLQKISPIAAEEQTIAPQDKKQTTDATAEHKEKRHGGYQIRLEGLEEQILGGYQNTKETSLGSGFYDLGDPYPHNPSVLKKVLGTVLGGIGSVFVGTAHADELEQPNKDEASSSTSRFSDVVDTVTRDFAEARHTVDDTHDFNLDNAQPTWVLNKFQPLYSRWKDARRVYLAEMSSLYGENVFEPDIYVQQAQSKWMLDHLTVGERRYNFNPGNPVLYHSASAAVFSERIYSTLAYDWFRFGNQDLGIGPTSFIVAKGTFSPLEIKNSKLNSNAKINLHTGTNVLQLNSRYLNANVNIYSCAWEGKVGDFLPDATPNLSSSVNQSCSKAEVLFTLKKEPICLGNTCLQGEGNVSLNFGKVSGKRDPSKTEKIELDAKSGYRIKSNARFQVTKKPKPT